MDWESLNILSRELASWMADASVRAALLALPAFVLVFFFRRRADALHLTWALVLIGMLALPFFRPLALSSPPVLRIDSRWLLLAAALYLAGVLFLALRLTAGIVWMSRTLRDTTGVDDELWMYYELVADTDAYVTLEESARVRVPLTTGWRRKRVILPSDWRGWPQASLKSVLAHELAHVGRGDPLVALAAAVNKCLFWFHPLAWWLERRLAVLAEHAADDAALLASPDAATYAKLLLDAAERMQASGSRLVWNAAAMSGPVIAHRIRRVLDLHTHHIKPLGKAASAMLLSAGAALILLVSFIDVRTLSGQPTTARLNPLPAEISRILWLIDHQPESSVHKGSYVIYPSAGREIIEEVARHWRAQVALHPNDPRVLENAAHTQDLPDEIDLLKRARELDPEHPTRTLALLYTWILTTKVYSEKYPAIVADVHSELAHSTDLSLVGAVARFVVEETSRAALAPQRDSKFNAARDLATELVTHAQSLDPNNRDWSDLMEGIKSWDAGPLGIASNPAPPTHATIRIDPALAQSMLLEAPRPIYPDYWKPREPGVAKLEIRIGTDGHVNEAKVVAGSAPPAVIDAALRYVYKPTIIKGEAVEVVTEIEIPYP